MTPWTAARQTPPSMGFSRQEYWSGLPFPPPGVFPNQGWIPCLLHCRRVLYSMSHQGSPSVRCVWNKYSAHSLALGELSENQLRAERQQAAQSTCIPSQDPPVLTNLERRASLPFLPGSTQDGVSTMCQAKSQELLPSLLLQRWADTPERITQWREEREGWREVGHGRRGQRGPGLCSVRGAGRGQELQM